MTIVIAINILLCALIFGTILSLKGWAVRTAHRDRLDASTPHARRERRVSHRPLPQHSESRRVAGDPARA